MGGTREKPQGLWGTCVSISGASTAHITRIYLIASPLCPHRLPCRMALWDRVLGPFLQPHSPIFLPMPGASLLHPPPPPAYTATFGARMRWRTEEQREASGRELNLRGTLVLPSHTEGPQAEEGGRENTFPTAPDRHPPFLSLPAVSTGITTLH